MANKCFSVFKSVDEFEKEEEEDNVNKSVSVDVFDSYLKKIEEINHKHQLEEGAAEKENKVEVNPHFEGIPLLGADTDAVSLSLSSMEIDRMNEEEWCYYGHKVMFRRNYCAWSASHHDRFLH